jgi:hypothetical protein
VNYQRLDDSGENMFSNPVSFNSDLNPSGSFFIIDPHPVQPCLGVTEPDLNSPPTALWRHQIGCQHFK